MRRRLGVFPGEDEDTGAIRALDEWLGGRLDVVTTFSRAAVPAQRRRQFVHGYLADVWAAGYTPILTWEPFEAGGPASATPVDAIADGTDSCVESWAADVAEWVQPAGGETRELYLRPAHEMNGSWYPWSAGAGASPSAYRRMWHRLVDAFADAGVPDDSVHWLWCPNAESTADVDALAFYPGDDCVDLVGVDGYNFGDSQSWSRWSDPAAVFEPSFRRLSDRLDAPLTVPEFGCSSARSAGHDPAAKAAWITEAFELFDAWDVRLASWFNTTKETDWSVFRPAGSPGGPAPEPVAVDGRSYETYPSFRRAAATYLDRA